MANKIATKDIQEMKDSQLVEYLRNSREELFNLRFRHATGELDSSANIKLAKKALARGLTVARQRNLDVNREMRRG